MNTAFLFSFLLKYKLSFFPQHVHWRQSFNSSRLQFTLEVCAKVCSPFDSMQTSLSFAYNCYIVCNSFCPMGRYIIQNSLHWYGHILQSDFQDISHHFPFSISVSRPLENLLPPLLERHTTHASLGLAAFVFVAGRSSQLIAPYRDSQRRCRSFPQLTDTINKTKTTTSFTPWTN